MATGTIKLQSPVVTELLRELSIPTTATSYNCNWSDYDFLLIYALHYSNLRSCNVVPKSAFSNTTAGSRPFVYDGVDSRYYAVYKDGNTKVYIGSNTSDAAHGVCIYGVKF